jgi:hypothetical protein
VAFQASPEQGNLCMVRPAQSMIRKSGHRFSEKIMLKSKEIERNDGSENVIAL